MDQERVSLTTESVETEAKTEAKASSALKLKKKLFKRSFICLIALIVASAIHFSAWTVAFFGENVSAGYSTIQAGNVDILLIETMQGADGITAYVDPVSIMPATSVSKMVSVKNTGDLPVYIRVKLDMSIEDENNKPAYWKELISCTYGESDTCNSDWILKQDGYYYYKYALAEGKSTAYLFDTVRFSPAMGNEFTNQKIVLSVTSEATQANGNGTSALDAAGWPTASN